MLKCEEVKIGEYVFLLFFLVTVHRAIYISMPSFSGQNERETTSAITITFPGSVHGNLRSDNAMRLTSHKLKPNPQQKI